MTTCDVAFLVIGGIIVAGSFGMTFRDACIEKKKYGHLSPEEKYVAIHKEAAENYQKTHQNKQIVGGKLYDCKTAKCLAVVQDDDPLDDDQEFGTDSAERRRIPTWSLWQKENGEFFICEVVAGNERPKIKPFTEDEAKKFIADNFNGEFYIDLFGPVEE